MLLFVGYEFEYEIFFFKNVGVALHYINNAHHTSAHFLEYMEKKRIDLRNKRKPTLNPWDGQPRGITLKNMKSSQLGIFFYYSFNSEFYPTNPT
jgi:hypothetical protein